VSSRDKSPDPSECQDSSNHHEDFSEQFCPQGQQELELPTNGVDATFEEAGGDSGSDWLRNSNHRCLKRRSPTSERLSYSHCVTVLWWLNWPGVAFRLRFGLFPARFFGLADVQRVQLITT
jgi:hypothetical protein